MSHTAERIEFYSYYEEGIERGLKRHEAYREAEKIWSKKYGDWRYASWLSFRCAYSQFKKRQLIQQD